MLCTAGTTGATIGTLDTGSVARTFNVSDGSARSTWLSPAALTGTGGITFNGGTGKSQFSGSNSNATGLVTVTQGTLELNKTSALIVRRAHHRRRASSRRQIMLQPPSPSRRARWTSTATATPWQPCQTAALAGRLVNRYRQRHQQHGHHLQQRPTSRWPPPPLLPRRC